MKPNTKPLTTHIGGRGANTIAPITKATANAPHPTAPSSLQLWNISIICDSSRLVHRRLEYSRRPRRPRILIASRLVARKLRRSRICRYFCSWHLCDIARSRMDFRFRGKSGHAADIGAMSEFDPNRTYSQLWPHEPRLLRRLHR